MQFLSRFGDVGFSPFLASNKTEKVRAVLSGKSKEVPPVQYDLENTLSSHSSGRKFRKGKSTELMTQRDLHLNPGSMGG